MQIGLIVDGITEVESIRQKFQKDGTCTPLIRKCDCNGVTVKPEVYARKAAPIISELVGSKAEKIICILDFEKRSGCPKDFAKSIKTAIIDQDCLSRQKKGRLTENLEVVVANVMFENWIVADIEGIKRKVDWVDDAASQEPYDGKSGTTILSKCMKIRYRKTSHAATLFKLVDVDRAIKNSPSFALFIQAVQTKAAPKP